MKELFSDKIPLASGRTRQIGKVINQSGDIISGAARLFEYAYSLEKSGLRTKAEKYYLKIIEIAEDLHRNNPTICSAYKLAQIAHNHGKGLFTFGRIEDAKKAFSRASELLTNDIADGVSKDVIELLAESLHWLARCQRKTGDLDGAQTTYSKSIPLLRNLLLFKLPLEKLEKLQVMFNTSVFGYSKLKHLNPTRRFPIQ